MPAARPRVPDEGMSEEEYTRNVNQAVADTEHEIWSEALGDEELDRDGDDSLEQMGDGLEGDHLTDDDDEEVGEEAFQAGEEGGEGEEGDEGDAESDLEGYEGDEVEGAIDRRYQEPELPPVHTEQRESRRFRTREESEALAQEESRYLRLERELAETKGRYDELSRRVNAQPPAAPQPEAPPDPEPDMWQKPEEWRAWNRRENERAIKTGIDAGMQQFRQQNVEQQQVRANASFNKLASSPRGYEFQEAYRRLLTMDPRNPDHVAQVQGIIFAPDPGSAILDWWENNGGPEYREQIFQTLTGSEGGEQEQMESRGRHTRGAAPRQLPPRHEVRLPQGMRRGPVNPNRMPPSLNSQGGGRQSMADPDLYDDSDAAVMAYAMRN